MGFFTAEEVAFCLGFTVGNALAFATGLVGAAAFTGVFGLTTGPV